MIKYTVKVHDGITEWFINGERHRENGPAIEWPDGSKEWWINGNLHRENGPAVEWASGSKYWWINGKQVTETDAMKHTITIDNKTIIISHQSFLELKKQLV